MRRAGILMLGALLAQFVSVAGAGQVVLPIDATETEINDARSNADNIFDVTGTLPSLFFDGDVDYYQLNVTWLPSTLTVTAAGVPGLDPTLLLQDENGADVASNDDIEPGVNLDAQITFAFTQMGTYYVRVSLSPKATFTPGISGYSLTGGFFLEDNFPPTYPDAFGILSVTRDGHGSAVVEWNEAEDLLTPQGAILYNVYWGPQELGLFRSEPGATFQGVTEGTVNGLNPNASYFFGVRAEDLAGNEEQNGTVLFAAPVLSVDPRHWSLYR